MGAGSGASARPSAPNRPSQAAALGEKKLEAQYNKEAKNYATTLSNSTKKALGIAADQTKVKVAGINATAKTTVAGMTAAQKKAALQAKGPTTGPGSAAARQAWPTVVRIRGTQGGQKVTGKTIASYTQNIQIPALLPNGQPDPTGTTTTKTIPLSVQDVKTGAWKASLPKGAKPVGSAIPKYQTGTQTVNVPSAQTRWKRAQGALVSQAGLTPAQARIALYQGGFPFPGVKTKVK